MRRCQVNLVPISTRTTVTIELKKGIIDAVGDVTRRSLDRLGFSYVNGVRSGKTMVITTYGPINARVFSDLQEMNRKLLSNPLVEVAKFEFASE
ncbi:MAG: phosphoribosylformylglycinamidine synthase subunit PurS [Candidatus Odinarchaeota archaeon]